MVTIEEAIEQLQEGQTIETADTAFASVLQDRLYWLTLPKTATRECDLKLAVQIRWCVEGYHDFPNGKETRSVSYGHYMFKPLALSDTIRPGVY